MVEDGWFRAANSEKMQSYLAKGSEDKRFASTKRMAWWRMAGSVPQIARKCRVTWLAFFCRVWPPFVEGKRVGREGR